MKGHLALACAALGMSACLTTASAQLTPAGPEFPVNTHIPGDQHDPDIAADADGAFVAVWSSYDLYHYSSTQDGSGSGVFGQLFDRDGQPLGAEFRVNETTAGDQDSPAVALSGDGFVVVWRSEPVWDGASQVFGRLYDRLGVPRGGELRLAGDSPMSESAPDVATDAAGNFSVVWDAGVVGTSGVTNVHLFLRRFDASGAPIGPASRVDSTAAYYSGPSAIASDAAGRSLVVWISATYDDDGLIFARRYDPEGQPAGDQLHVSERPESFNPDVSCSPAGNCVVVWENRLLQLSVYARRFPAGGGTIPEFLVALFSGGGFAGPRISCDAAGGFAVAWDFGEGVGMRRYDPAGIRQGPAFGFANRHDIVVASNAGGDLVALYLDPYTHPFSVDVVGHRFLLPPSGADPCLFQPSGRLSCDVFRDGGEAELEISLQDTAALGVPLLGNLDGDTRDDFCLYQAGRLRCDKSHDGRLVFWPIFGGAAGDRPLIGDVNGDGRDDLCLRRRQRFLCDTAHDGGTAEVQILFGRSDDEPLLGDLDGDGDDDPCLFRGGQFLCDTAHDGGAAELALTFGEPGDTPLLADFDHDGDDDPCLYRAGVFLCDTAHDGGAPEVSVAFFGEAGAVPLLGNINGI